MFNLSFRLSFLQAIRLISLEWPNWLFRVVLLALHPEECSTLSRMVRVSSSSPTAVTRLRLRLKFPVLEERPVRTSFVMLVYSIQGRLQSSTCHGSKDGRNGFKLSLRGYDALYDIRAFTDDIKSRRVNVASPDKSLMLLKATGSVPHEGQQVFKHGSKYYGIIRQWISQELSSS